MEESLIFEGKKFISSKRASEITGYAKDYIGQLCRAGRIEARLVGRNWYVEEESILKQTKKGKRSTQESPEGHSSQNTTVSHEELMEKSPITSTIPEQKVCPALDYYDHKREARHRELLDELEVKYYQDGAERVAYERDEGPLMPVLPKEGRSERREGEVRITISDDTRASFEEGVGREPPVALKNIHSTKKKEIYGQSAVIPITLSLALIVLIAAGLILTNRAEVKQAQGGGAQENLALVDRATIVQIFEKVVIVVQE